MLLTLSLDKVTVEISLTYFMPTGIYLTQLTTTCEARTDQFGGVYMNDVVNWVKDLREKSNTLPGLPDYVTWDGYILLDCEKGYPVLVLPKE